VVLYIGVVERYSVGSGDECWEGRGKKRRRVGGTGFLYYGNDCTKSTESGMGCVTKRVRRKRFSDGFFPL